MESQSGKSVTVIMIIWRHLLNLNKLKKPPNIRLIVVGPSNMVIDENCIDIMHHVEGPITPRDQNYAMLLQKVRELCAGLLATSFVEKTKTSENGNDTSESKECVKKHKIALCVFERRLQRNIAEIRAEFDIDGLKPAQFDQLMNRKIIRSVCRRGGLSTLKAVSLGSVQGQTEAWVKYANEHVGSYPMFLRPVNAEINCMHTLCMTKNSDELRTWMKLRNQNANYSVEYMVEECLENGYEFISIYSCTTGLIGTFTTIDIERTLYASVKTERAYGIEYLNAERTRDIMPGVESFVVQCMKTFFGRSLNSLLFLKGFYRGHNAITFLGGSFELRKRSLAQLFQEANCGKSWEVFVIETIIRAYLPPYSLSSVASSTTDTDCSLNDTFLVEPNPIPRARFSSLIQNGANNCCHINNICSIELAQFTDYYALVNFPCSEGFLLHQTAIPPTKSVKRLAWRVSEGEEILDSDGIDDNVLQIFLHNSNRTELLADVKLLTENVDITIDKFCLTEKRHSNASNAQLCFSNAKHNCTSSAMLTIGETRYSNNMQLIRSCTTTD